MYTQWVTSRINAIQKIITRKGTVGAVYDQLNNRKGLATCKAFPYSVNFKILKILIQTNYSFSIGEKISSRIFHLLALSISQTLT